MKKRIGFMTYSLPFRWWDNTNIAHNKIFAWALMELQKCEEYECCVLGGNLDFFTQQKIKSLGCKCLPCNQINTDSCDSVILFCGPFMPIGDEKSITYQTIRALSSFEGSVAFVTCDYLLQINLNVRRYGKMFSDIPDDGLLRNKEWKYVLHGGFDHHFRTEHQKNQILSCVKKENILEVPLNKAGITPEWGHYAINEKPPIDLLYCGAPRANRTEFFLKYFASPEAKKWMVSTTQEKKFKDIPGINTQIRGPFAGKIWDFINKSWAQILFTDSSDKKIDSTPLPTRYWEAVSAQSVIFCDAEATIWWDIKPEELLVVEGPKQLAENISHLKKDSAYRKQCIEKQNDKLKGFDPYVEWQIDKWL